MMNDVVREILLREFQEAKEDGHAPRVTTYWTTY
jgi:hypothetical protein